MRKLLTVAIPCYNSQDYMDHAIDTVLVGGEEIEILLVDDGSTDRTPQIADEYAEKYPDIIRAIHQENKGHGGAVNTGVQHATGMYFKVLDSDDWLDKEAFLDVLDKLKSLVADRKPVDMLLCNYIYDKPSKNRQKVIKYTNVLPVDRVFTWDHVGHFRTSQNILMHAVIYRTKMLRQSGMVLPEHTFYVDNLFVYQPFPYVKTMYYMDVDLYHYFIGREDQSVNESVMIGRIDQQIRVNKLMIDSPDLTKLENKGLRNYMTKYLAMIMMVTTSLLVKSGTPENLEKRDELWEYLKAKPGTYKLVNHRFLSKPIQFRTAPGRLLIKTCYTIAQKIYNFN